MTVSVSPRAEDSTHWAFQPISRPDLPSIVGASARNPIDGFIQAGLKTRKLAPSPPAPASALLRRLYLDLVGMPPKPHEIAQFGNNPPEETIRKTVDRLLASPHFGERWALPWLDLARYGDSHGYERDEPRRYAWMWREWLINAINEDKPYDQFTIEQIAGDLLPNPSFEQILATGFHRHSPYNTAGGTDREELRVNSIIDRVNTVGSVWLGLSIGCAQCHDHKYDPISQKDYYQLFAFFNDEVDDSTLTFPTTEKEQKDYERRLAKHGVILESLETQFEAAPDNQKREIEVQIKRHKKRTPTKPASAADVLKKRIEKSRESYVFGSGDFRNKKAPVKAAVPGALQFDRHGQDSNETLNRLDLAEWLIDSRNPLVARVEVDRIWRTLFGEGLVATPEDFGTRSPEPIQIDLLDWMAAWFVEHDWSRKALIRLITQSATYRQSTTITTANRELDETNALFSRQNRYRLQAELVRDVNLATGNLLRTESIGGWSFRPALPESMRNLPPNYRWEHDVESEWLRRGVYLWVQRNMIHPDLKLFDKPERVAACAARDRTNTPLQALKQWNDPFNVPIYRSVAQSILSDGRPDLRSRIETLFLTCLSRPPEKAEIEVLEEQHARYESIYRSHPSEAKTWAGESLEPDIATGELATWMSLARLVINLDEFIMRP